MDRIVTEAHILYSVLIFPIKNASINHKTKTNFSLKSIDVASRMHFSFSSESAT